MMANKNTRMELRSKLAGQNRFDKQCDFGWMVYNDVTCVICYGQFILNCSIGRRDSNTLFFRLKYINKIFNCLRCLLVHTNDNHWMQYNYLIFVSALRLRFFKWAAKNQIFVLIHNSHIKYKFSIFMLAYDLNFFMRIV